MRWLLAKDLRILARSRLLLVVVVVYNGNALEQSLVQAQLSSALAQANLGFSGQIQQAASSAINQLLHGGNASELAAPANLVGLRQIPPLLARVIANQPRGADRS